MQAIVNVRSAITISLRSISIGKLEPSWRQPIVSTGRFAAGNFQRA